MIGAANRFARKEEDWDLILKVDGVQIPRKDFLEKQIFHLDSLADNKPISPDDLRVELENKMSEEISSDQNALTQPDKSGEKIFSSLREFNFFYLNNKSEFSEKQQSAFDTLIQAEGSIDKGCSCKRNQRESAAFGYYKDFFIRNSSTDMIPSIKNAAKAEKLVFKLGADVFLEI